MNRTTTCIVAIFTMAALPLGCGDDTHTVKQVQQALELPNGGFDMQDELPNFGQPGVDLVDLDGVDSSQLSPAVMPDLSTFAKGKKCKRGKVKGTWKRLHPGLPFGLFMGKWTGRKGGVRGALSGIWGKTGSGKRYFFGKAIDKSGKFVALLNGTWGKGKFKGVMVSKTHKDKLRGKYGKGTFKGKWKRTCGRKFLTSCHPAKVLSYKVGTTSGGGKVSPVRQEPDEALGLPRHNWGLSSPVDNTVNFVSLGKGGELVLDWGGPVKPKQLWVIETSWGDHNNKSWPCAKYPEKVEAYVSKNGKKWTYLGSGCRDSAFAVTGWFRYVKLMDASGHGQGYWGDGYDVDGLDVCGGKSGHTYIATYGQATPVP